MIPYDDLVAALSAWRARQGLPVNDIGAGSGPHAHAASGPYATPGSGPHDTPGSGPHGTPGSGPHDTPGSGPHGTPGSGPNRPPPPAPVYEAEPMEVADEAMLDEEAYENEGDDFAMKFGGAAPPATDDATAIGSAPERPTEADLARDDRDDW